MFVQSGKGKLRIEDLLFSREWASADAQLPFPLGLSARGDIVIEDLAEVRNYLQERGIVGSSKGPAEPRDILINLDDS